MALNLEKSNIEKSYYYSEKGNTYGPFLLSVIIVLPSIIGTWHAVGSHGLWFSSLILIASAPLVLNIISKKNNKLSDFIILFFIIICISLAKISHGAILLIFIISKINTEPSNINSETLITSDGNKWTKANEIPELKIYFNKGQPKKVRTNKLFIWAIFIGFVGGGLVYYLNNKNNYTPPIEEPLPPTREDELSDFEIFDIYAIRNLNPSEEQKLLASNLVEESKVAMKNQDYTNAIIKYKESLNL